MCKECGVASICEWSSNWSRTRNLASDNMDGSAGTARRVEAAAIVSAGGCTKECGGAVREVKEATQSVQGVWKRQYLTTWMDSQSGRRV